MVLTAATSLITPTWYHNKEVETKIVNQSEYDIVDSAWGYSNPNGNIYVFNLNTNNENNKKHNKDKQHTIDLKRGKEKIVDSLTKINLCKSKLKTLNPSIDDDAIMIRKLNLKMHKESEKIRKIEREFDLDASQFQSQSVTPEQPKTFVGKVKEVWSNFWNAIKNFFSKHIEEIASIATISCSVLLILLKCFK